MIYLTVGTALHPSPSIGHSLIWEAATTTIKLVDRSELQIDCNCSRFLCFIDCMCCTFTSIWTALIYYLIQQRRWSLDFDFNCWKNQNLGGYHIVFINKYEERQSENNKAEAAIVCTSNSNLSRRVKISFFCFKDYIFHIHNHHHLFFYLASSTTFSPGTTGWLLLASLSTY